MSGGDGPSRQPAVLLDATTLRTEVERLGRELTRDHPEGLLLVGVLRGALIFLADLARAVQQVPVEIDFISISRFAPDTGRVKILHDLRSEIGGRDVVVVEDIVDTGLTLTYLMKHLGEHAPRRLEACALIDRPERRIVPIDVRYRGIEVEGDVYALGYGLHFRDLYRNLPFVVRGERDALVTRPEEYVADLYGGGAGGGDWMQSGAEGRE